MAVVNAVVAAIVSYNCEVFVRKITHITGVRTGGVVRAVVVVEPAVIIVVLVGAAVVLVIVRIVRAAVGTLLDNDSAGCYRHCMLKNRCIGTV